MIRIENLRLDSFIILSYFDQVIQDQRVDSLLGEITFYKNCELRCRNEDDPNSNENSIVAHE